MSGTLELLGTPIALELLLLQLLGLFPSLTWATQGKPPSLLGTIGDMSIDPETIPGSIVYWQRESGGWVQLGSVVLTPPSSGGSSFDFSNADNSGLIPTL